MRPERLLEFSSPDGTVISTQFRADLNYSAISDLQQAFQDSYDFIPVLAIGEFQLGKGKVMDDLIAVSIQSSNQKIAIEETFANKTKTEAALDVWPLPIICEGRHFLFMKFSGIDFTSVSEFEMKAIYVALAVSSYAFFFSENEMMFKGLNVLLEASSKLEAASALGPTKWLIFAEKEGIFERIPNSLTGLADLLGKQNANIFDFEFRGRGDLSQQAQYDVLWKLVYGDRFAYRHASLSAKHPIIAFCEVLQTLSKLATLHPTVSQFSAYLPNFYGEASEQVRAAEMQIAHINDLAQAEVIRLFSPESSSAPIGRELISKLSAGYDFLKRIVIMLIIGHQGLGKSTLLNKLLARTVRSDFDSNFFAVTSTGEHTTRNSQILSRAAYMPNSRDQLMMIDQEGLMGMEVDTPAKVIAQTKLVCNTVTLASVHFILIANEVARLAFAEQIVERIARVNAEAGLMIERIFFLFHDKDFDRSVGNAAVTQTVKLLNRRFFMDKEVVVVVNKPSMVDPAKREMQLRFLDYLLSQSDIPKRTASGKDANVGHLIANLMVPFNRFMTLPFYLRGHAEGILDHKCKALDYFCESVRAAPHCSLISLFNEEHQRLITETKQELTDQRQCDFVLAGLVTHANTLKIKLLKTEICFGLLRDGAVYESTNVQRILEAENEREIRTLLEFTRRKYPEMEQIMAIGGILRKNLVAVTVPAVSLMTRTGIFQRSWELGPSVLQQVSEFPTTIVLFASSSSPLLQNQFVRTLFPFTRSNFCAFSSTESMQILPMFYFAYNENLSDRISRKLAQILLISIQIPVDKQKSAEHKANIARALLTRVSVACVCIDVQGPPNACLTEILAAATMQDDGTILAFRKQKVIVTVSGVESEAHEQQARKIAEDRMIPEVLQIRSVSEDSCFPAVFALKSAIEAATPMTFAQARDVLSDSVREANGGGSS